MARQTFPVNAGFSFPGELAQESAEVVAPPPVRIRCRILSDVSTAMLADSIASSEQ